MGAGGPTSRGGACRAFVRSGRLGDGAGRVGLVAALGQHDAGADGGGGQGQAGGQGDGFQHRAGRRGLHGQSPLRGSAV